MRILLTLIEGGVVILLLTWAGLQIRSLLKGPKQKSIDQLKQELAEAEKEAEVRRLRRDLDQKRAAASNEELADLERLLAEAGGEPVQTLPSARVRVPEGRDH